MRGSLWQLPDGRWRIRWRTHSGRRPSQTYRLKKDAEAALVKRISEAERGIDVVDRRLTISDVIVEWEKSTKPSVKPRTWDSYDQHVRDHIKPQLGSQRLMAVNQRMVQRFVNGLTTKGLAPKTVRGIHSTLTLVLKEAGADLVHPITGVKLPRSRNATRTS